MDNPLYPAIITVGGSDTKYTANKVLGIRIHADQSFDLQYTFVKSDLSTPYSVDSATSTLRVAAYKNKSFDSVLLVSGVHTDSGSGTVDRVTFTVPAGVIPEDIAVFPLRTPGNAVFFAIIEDGAGKKIEVVAEVNVFDTDYALTGEANPSAQTIVPNKNDLGTVESSNLTTPPTPTLNVAYIVGAGATGLWSGQDLDLAIGTGSAWVFLTPVVGNFVYDKNLAEQIVFDSSVWISVTGAPFADDNALIKNESDNTKLIKFDASAISTATTRTVTMPDEDIDLTPSSGSFGSAANVSTNNSKVSNVTTNLTTTQTSTTVDVVSSDGTNATLPQAIAGGDAGVMSGADKTKVDAAISEADVSGTVRAYTKQQTFGTVPLADAANIAWDLDDEQAARVILHGNRTLDNPNNMKDGGEYTVRIVQDGTGSRTLSYGTAYDFGDAGAPVLSTTADKTDIIKFFSDGFYMFFGSLFKGFAPSPDLANAFVTVWDTENLGGTGSATKVILLPMTAGNTVDWGDGTVDTLNTHTYSVGGIKTVKISGGVTGWLFNNTGDKLKLTDVTSVGGLVIDNLGLFYGCANLTWSATVAPYITTTSLLQTFRDCSLFNGNIGNWITSTATTMRFMFFNCTVFNQDLDSWDTSSVTDMSSMFQSCPVFNQPINSWDVSSVTTMASMLRICTAFNQPLNSWTTSALLITPSMLQQTAFDQDISNFDVSGLTDASQMLLTSSFSQTNYDLLLVAWEAQTLQTSVAFHAGTAKYGAGAPATARGDLVGAPNLWTITDGGAA